MGSLMLAPYRSIPWPGLTASIPSLLWFVFGWRLIAPFR